eukprot:233654_1
MTLLSFLSVLIAMHTKVASEASISSFGKWQRWGGNLENQQTAVYASDKLTKDSLKSLLSDNDEGFRQCTYDLNDTSFTEGFIAVDNMNRAILTTTSGLIQSIDLDECELIWSQNITELLIAELGLNLTEQTIIYSRDSVALYKLSTDDDNDDLNDSYSIFFSVNAAHPIFIPFPLITEPHCYAISLSNNGDLEWLLNLGQDRYENTMCSVHGFVIDGIYAFGGMASESTRTTYKYQGFRGKMMKINLVTHSMEDIWYSFPQSKSGKANESSYTGGGIWGWPALIDDYIVFGTGQMYSVPDYINECWRNTSMINFDTHSENICGDDVANESLYWKCMESDGVYPSSLIVLNKTNFELKIGAILIGLDAWTGFDCGEPATLSPINNTNCPSFVGPDGDLSALSSYYDYNTNTTYAAGLSKTGMFYVYDIEDEELKISKKVSPWGIVGGGIWSLAIDQKTMIAVVTITGSNENRNLYRQTMADGNIICFTGNVHAIDLNTGYTIWQMVDPYGNLFNDSFCYTFNVSMYELNKDVSVNGTCQRAFDGSQMLSPLQTATDKVFYPAQKGPFPRYESIVSGFWGATTIVNDIILIPSSKGDIYIHNLKTGEYIDSITCPDYQITLDENQTVWYRGAVGKGVSVYDDRMVFLCEGRNGTFNTQLISLKLNLVEEDTGLNKEGIIFIVIGSVLGASVIGIALYFYCKFRKKDSVYKQISEQNKILITEIK